MFETRRGFAFAENGEVKGYGVIRQCDDGFKIGPLFLPIRPTSPIRCSGRSPGR
ncbi:hypothetical protein QW131_07550 [Roseibium salinum]|nr:hypothetical protein [Roseibium salinum]